MYQPDIFIMSPGSDRHALPEGFHSQSLALLSKKSDFEYMLEDIPMDGMAMEELKDLGFNARQDVPGGQFHSRFPAASHVTRFESTAAYAYTVGSVFAYEMNRLMLAEDWHTLFDRYGRVVKCLWNYCEKMQDAYGQEQRLYRGMRLQRHKLDKYEVGQNFQWNAFSSTSTSKDIAYRFATSQFASSGWVPVVFEISTLTRGAPILKWSKYPFEEEVLLMPFQGFSVDGMYWDERVLVVQLSTVRTGLLRRGGAGIQSVQPQSARILQRVERE